MISSAFSEGRVFFSSHPLNRQSLSCRNLHLGMSLFLLDRPYRMLDRCISSLHPYHLHCFGHLHEQEHGIDHPVESHPCKYQEWDREVCG